MSNEAFARVRIDALLAAQGWDALDTNAVRFEVQLPDGTRADYVLCDRHGRSLAVIEVKRYSVSPGDAAAQAKAYAQQLGVPYAFLCNGDEVQFWEWQREAYPRPVKDDLQTGRPGAPHRHAVRAPRPRECGRQQAPRTSGLGWCVLFRGRCRTGPPTGPRPKLGRTRPAWMLAQRPIGK